MQCAFGVFYNGKKKGVKRCILHIGQSKTGTSAIQSYLDLNKERLKRQGILYPGVKFHGVALNLFNHNSVADSLAGLKRYPEMETEEYFRQFSRQLKNEDCQTMIISGEHFFGGEPRVWNVTSKEAYLLAYMKKLHVLQSFLQEYELTIIIYLRSQAEWLASAISQVIRYEGLIGKKIYQNDRHFFELMKPVLDYDNLIEQWLDILKPKKFICIPYEKDELHGNNSVSDFLFRLGINDEELIGKAVKFNEHESLSREYIELKKTLNKEACSKTEEWVRIYCLNKAYNKSNTGKKYKLSTELYRQIQEYYSSMNVRITEKYIKEGVFSINVTKNKAVDTCDNDNVAKATEEFYKEYYSFSVKIKRLEIHVKTYLRTHMKPLHAILYKIKTKIKTNLYHQS